MRGLEAAAHLPRILLSSACAPDETREGSFDAVLPKPVKVAQLFDAMLEALGNAKPLSRARKSTYAPDADLSRRHPLRILLTDDNRVNRKVMVHLLERLGYHADVACDGVEAVAAVKAKRYDLVLMDVQMPEMDGLEATRQICKLWAPGDRPRIVAMTANAMRGDREECLAAGMDDYLSKPVRMPALENMLAHVQAQPTPSTSSRPTTNTEGAIDTSVLDQLAMLGQDPAMLREVLDDFFEDAETRLPVLRDAVASRDADTVRREAHSIKGNAAMIGAIRLTAASAELERLARGANLLGAEALVELVENELEVARSALLRLDGVNDADDSTETRA